MRALRTFSLLRKEDISGVSGTGTIAEGVVFHDGQVVLSWFGRFHTIEVCPTIDTVIALHGHNGSTFIQWDDVPTQKGTLRGKS